MAGPTYGGQPGDHAVPAQMAGISAARQRTPYPSTPAETDGSTPSLGLDPVTPTPAYIDAVRSGGIRRNAAQVATAITTTARTRKAVA